MVDICLFQSIEVFLLLCCADAGMNKLLARLPDRSREEVRNQAIIFIQQLTAKNEEMKKTVVFNEVVAAQQWRANVDITGIRWFTGIRDNIWNHSRRK
jgi:hypothetical protein